MTPAVCVRPPQGDRGREASLGTVPGSRTEREFSRFWYELTVLCWRKQRHRCVGDTEVGCGGKDSGPEEG